LTREDLQAGDRVAVWLPNCVDWVSFDIASLGLGLIVVPLYAHDSISNIAGILSHCEASLLFLNTHAQWADLLPHLQDLPSLSSVWIRESNAHTVAAPAKRLNEALRETASSAFQQNCSKDSLATIIYTSGTTDKPKGCMLTHFALLWNAEAVTKNITPYTSDIFLSILPLAHAFERTVGYYVPIMGGCTVAFSRSIGHFPADLKIIQPTVLLSVPRLYERAYKAIKTATAGNALNDLFLKLAVRLGWRKFEAAQGRARPLGFIENLVWSVLEKRVALPIKEKFGGNLRVAVTGGAPMPDEIAKLLVALGMPIVAGYGLTEAGPVVSSNALEDNFPTSVGRPLEGIKVSISDDGELLVRSPSAMSGYWNDPTLTSKAQDAEGWIHTGDLAKIEDYRLFITGRLTEILVLSNGKKANASLIEAELARDELFDQVLVVGEGKPFLVAICTLNRENWQAYAGQHGLDPDTPNTSGAVRKMLARISDRLEAFPRHARIRAVHLVQSPWTIPSGLLTPTLKVKRKKIEQVFDHEISTLYGGHRIFR
jgi:long-chain acyl-CoA synthetase